MLFNSFRKTLKQGDDPLQLLASVCFINSHTFPQCFKHHEGPATSFICMIRGPKKEICYSDGMIMPGRGWKGHKNHELKQYVFIHINSHTTESNEEITVQNVFQYLCSLFFALLSWHSCTQEKASLLLLRTANQFSVQISEH